MVIVIPTAILMRRMRRRGRRGRRGQMGRKEMRTSLGATMGMNLIRMRISIKVSRGNSISITSFYQWLLREICLTAITPLLTKLTKKLLYLSITFITQRFPKGDNAHSPLIYFNRVLGINIKNRAFTLLHNYISLITELVWVYWLFTIEYALSK
jgi:hypothetical protein